MPDFCGHPVATLENDSLRLDYLIDVGPRIARLMAFGRQESLLAELPGPGLESEFGRFEFMGGHRLWHAPEAIPRTYVPDQAVEVEAIEGGVRLSAGVEPGTGMAKILEIRMAAEGAEVHVKHILSNQGQEAVELAPWAITMLRLGGLILLPQAQGDVDADGLLPNRNLVLWPYTSLEDVRLRLTDGALGLAAQGALPPCKLGHLNRMGWAAYWRAGLLFVKQFEAPAETDYPDQGCNVESYCNDLFVELETLGPLATLEPGARAEHAEHWRFFEMDERDLGGMDLDEVRAEIEARL